MEADCVSECDESLDISVEDEEEEEDGSQGEEFNNRYCSSKKIKIISATLRSFGKRDKEKEFYVNALSLGGNKLKNEGDFHGKCKCSWLCFYLHQRHFSI